MCSIFLGITQIFLSLGHFPALFFAPKKKRRAWGKHVWCYWKIFQVIHRQLYEICAHGTIMLNVWSWKFIHTSGFPFIDLYPKISALLSTKSTLFNAATFLWLWTPTICKIDHSADWSNQQRILFIPHDSFEFPKNSSVNSTEDNSRDIPDFHNYSFYNQIQLEENW